MKTIKYLKLEIDELTCNLNYFKENKEKIEREINESDKIKSQFEKANIQLIEENSSLKTKLETISNVLKQKEKYIDILMKEKNKGFKQGPKEELEKKAVKKKNNSISSKEIMNINSNLILQNKVSEYERILEEKEKVIKTFEFEKMNLMNRIRNKKD